MSEILGQCSCLKRLWKMEIEHTQHCHQHCPSCRVLGEEVSLRKHKGLGKELWW